MQGLPADGIELRVSGLMAAGAKGRENHPVQELKVPKLAGISAPTCPYALMRMLSALLAFPNAGHQAWNCVEPPPPPPPTAPNRTTQAAELH